MKKNRIRVDVKFKSRAKQKIMNKNDEKATSSKQEINETKVYGAPGSTLQSAEENRHDKQVDPRKDNTLEVSNDDLHKTDIDRFHEIVDGKRGDTPIDDTLSNEK